MQAPVPVAARAAARRAQECHIRVIELARRQEFTCADVSRAQDALASARQRAAIAESRLSGIRSRRGAMLGVSPLACGDPADVGGLDAPDIRHRSAGVDFSSLFACYVRLGGACTAFELEAFINAALELADSELVVLRRAVSQITGFQPDRGSDRSGTAVFAAEPLSARRARHWLAERLAQLGVCTQASLLHDDAIQVVSELVANAVKAQAKTVWLSADASPGSLRIEVTDDAPGWPTLRHAAPEAPSGRGVALVMALSREWRVTPTALGKKVSVVLDVPQAGLHA